VARQTAPAPPVRTQRGAAQPNAHVPTVPKQLIHSQADNSLLAVTKPDTARVELTNVPDLLSTQIRPDTQAVVAVVNKTVPHKAAKPSVRRFRVVHQNEILTDQDFELATNSPASPDRRESFVRLGVASAIPAAAEVGTPTLRLSLSPKKNQ
jgi:hypothetical protein